ncbi:universal stress protein [Ilumatobacter sp.]|uniref:universal stress protein n=1 Tax=Ilumatobacter sp. TaxID=1967498 RepID=UPI00375390B9
MNKINIATALFVLDGPNPAPDSAAAADLLFASEIDWSILAIVAEHPQFTTGATGFAGPVLTPQEIESLAMTDLMAGDAAAAATARAFGPRPVVQSVRRGQPARAVGRYLDENPTDLVVVDSPHLAGDLVDDGIVPVLVVPSDGMKSTGGPVLVAIDDSPLDDVVTASATRLFDPTTTDFITVHIDAARSVARLRPENVAGQSVAHAAVGHTETVAEAGDPASGILAEAEDREASMIVLGTHNRGWLSRLFRPSVADAVLQQTQRPVLLMSSPDD